MKTIAIVDHYGKLISKRANIHKAHQDDKKMEI